MKQVESKRWSLNKQDWLMILKVLTYLAVSVIIYVLIEIIGGVELRPEVIALINLILVGLKKWLSDNGEIINIKK